MRNALTAARHLGQYTIKKYDVDIDAFYRDPLFARQASALALPTLIDLCSMDGREEATNERAVRAHGRDALDAQAARYLAAAGFHARHRAYDTVITDPNVMITKGITQLWTALTGGGVNAGVTDPVTYNGNNYLSTHTAGLGVGDGAGSVPTAAASDTDLAATANYLYIAVNATPTISAGQLTLQCSLSATQANFAVNEVVAGNFANAVTFVQGLGQTTTAKIGTTPGTASYSLLSHKGQSLGLKSNPQTWTISFSDTIS